MEYETQKGLDTPLSKIRKDTAAEKRIELHCHIKMSAMDGVADVAALVNRAYEWGHPAIALTDHGVVYSFPEADYAMQQIDRRYMEQYAVAHPDASKEELKKISALFKVLYGCEINLVDYKKEMVHSPKVFAKNLRRKRKNGRTN